MPARRARIVLVSARGRVALIRRRRGEQEYWSFPGGGIKRGETPHRAARRELAEELGLDVRPERLLAVASGQALFLATIDTEPPLRMRGPEVARRSRRHRYQPEWVPLHRLAELDVRPRTARVALVPLTGSVRPGDSGHDSPSLHERPVEPLRRGLQEAVETPVEASGESRAAAAPHSGAVPLKGTSVPHPDRPAPRRPRRWSLAWRRWRRRDSTATGRREGGDSPSCRP